MASILLVEDDKAIIENLTEFLAAEGFQVKAVSGQSQAVGLLEEEACGRIERALSGLGFQTQSPVEPRKLLKAVERDKKADGGTLHMIFPERIGSCAIRPISLAELAELFK